MQSPINNVIVTIDRKYIGHITDVLRTSQLTPGSQLNPADLVNIIGTVVSAPKSIQKRMDYKGYSQANIREGDTAIFRYDVIFSFVKQPESEEPIYKNEFWYKGQSYWRVDIQKLFAVVRNGRIIMLNGYCMLENMSNKSSIVLPESLKKYQNVGSATLTHIGKNMVGMDVVGAMPLDTVYYNPLIVQKYKINDKEFGIIRQRDIYASNPPNIIAKEFN